MTYQHQGTYTTQDINLALEEVSRIVSETGNTQDMEYFRYHRKRFLRMANSLAKMSPRPTTILDIGSHYLHSSLLLKFLGYEVYSMDVGEFWEVDFVKARQVKFGLNQVVENSLEHLNSQSGISDKYDVVLFTEILEHITFNPIVFWKKIYGLIRTNGFIYISTPNSMNLPNIIRSLARIITLRGIGEPVNEIFRKVTYGHHWKEYSSSEIKRYFSKMSDDFEVSVSKYHYIPHRVTSFQTGVIALMAFLGNASYFLAEDLEAVVSVNKSGNWKISTPEY